jgi:hypothetical protein
MSMILRLIVPDQMEKAWIRTGKTSSLSKQLVWLNLSHLLSFCTDVRYKISYTIYGVRTPNLLVTSSLVWRETESEHRRSQ